jgi:hypothetical protein
MLKSLTELTHDENLMLLELVAKGEVDEKDVNGNVFFAIEYSDYFLGLMTAGNQVNNDEKITVICLGESRTARELMTKVGSIEVVNGDGEVIETIKKTRDNYL